MQSVVDVLVGQIKRDEFAVVGVVLPEAPCQL